MGPGPGGIIYMLKILHNSKSDNSNIRLYQSIYKSPNEVEAVTYPLCLEVHEKSNKSVEIMLKFAVNKPRTSAFLLEGCARDRLLYAYLLLTLMLRNCANAT